jgi:starch phosphorylase
MTNKNNLKQILVAYFTMEVGIESDIPTYAGGLGILAGDTLRSFADLNVPVIGVSLLYWKGSFRQSIADGKQIEEEVRWSPKEYMNLLPQKVTVMIEDRKVVVRAWEYRIKGLQREVPVLFLDTNLPGNNSYDRTLTHYLYGNDTHYRLCQEIVLGIGGMRMLEAIHVEPLYYHMNEGHSALLTLELLSKSKRDVEFTWDAEHIYNNETVRGKCVFTTHTPVEAGHDRFGYEMVSQLLTDAVVPLHVIQEYGGKNDLNMTTLALNLSKYINGVAKKHGEVSKQMFPGYDIESITNGIHSAFWTSPTLRVLYDKYIPGWVADPFSLRYALGIPDNQLWTAHLQAKQALIQEVNKRTRSQFKEDAFTIGYARRFTGYKRPDLVFHDVGRLKAIAEKVGDIQLIFAGKAHPKDQYGKELIQKVIATGKELNGRVRVVFLENYTIDLAKLVVAGCDVWLNNPQRPHEASGTSGMKAAVNGVPQISTLDGWWLEGHIEGITGWAIGPHPGDSGFEHDSNPGDEAQDLYEKLEHEIVPRYYHDNRRWITIMKYAIAINGSFFNTHRMVQQYVTHSYFS